MSIADAFAAPPVTKSCKVCAILDALPEGRVAVERALAAPIETWPHTEITARLEAAGFDVGTDSIRRHRTRCVGR